MREDWMNSGRVILRRPFRGWRGPLHTGGMPGLGAVLTACFFLIAGVPTQAERIGPSVPCVPSPLDALGKLSCSDDALARADLRVVETYYVKRQSVGPDGQKALKAELLTFLVNARRSCGLP